jgi:hypothetical protein
MALKVVTTRIDGVKGETNIWDLDASIALVAADDTIWFTAKHKKADTDADAVLKLGNKAPLSGVAITNEALGQFRVTSGPADLAAVGEEALVYDVKVKFQANGVIQTVASGVLYLVESVNKDAA